MDKLVKNKDTTFLPILLGTDANAYGMARNFHQAYGIKSLALGKIPLLETRHSKIVQVQTCPDFDTDDKFREVMDEIARTYTPIYDNLILIACGDRYTELISSNKDWLSDNFIVPYIDLELKEKLENKEDFYNICEEYGLDYPATVMLHKDSQPPFDLPFDYPIAVKASDSIEYVALDFPGKKKAYKANSPAELEQIFADIYGAGYTGTLIVQDFIPGDDATMYVLNSYSDKNGKVQAMCLGHCVLEDYTPAGIGNYNAIIQEGIQEVYDKYKKFLEDIGFVGFSNFDIKYDERDGRYKVFEINIRQGRSSFFTTTSDCNLVPYLVQDRIYNREVTEVHYHNNPALWLHVPPRLLLQYAPERVLPQIRQLLHSGHHDCTLLYDKDLTPYRRVMINRFYHQQWQRYEDWFNKLSIND
ncbi:MAG: carboxylate--amine ligase [Peptococcaceae bacterium]|nr:carboxylate--amine ligase [Peptococcaceae bacterium]